jgi:hypothetical protein
LINHLRHSTVEKKSGDRSGACTGGTRKRALGGNGAVSWEQVYVKTTGKGRMLIEEEEREVGTAHCIENVSEEILTYVLAATPALDAEATYGTGQLRPEGWRRRVAYKESAGFRRLSR